MHEGGAPAAVFAITQYRECLDHFMPGRKALLLRDNLHGWLNRLFHEIMPLRNKQVKPSGEAPKKIAHCCQEHGLNSSLSGGGVTIHTNLWHQVLWHPRQPMRIAIGFIRRNAQ